MATGVLGQLVLILSGIAVARMLGPSGRGVVALAIIVPVIAVEVGTLGVPRAVTFELARAGGSLHSVVAAALPIARTQAVATIVCVACASLALTTVEPQLGVSGYLAVGYVPLGVTIAYGLAILQGVKDYWWFNTLRLAAGLAYVVFVLLLFALGAHREELVVLVWLIGYGIAATALVMAVRRHLTSTSPGGAYGSGPSSSALLKRGIRYLPSSLQPLGSMRLDHLVAGIALAPTLLGQYVVASSLCNLPRFLAQSSGMVAYPTAATNDARGSHPSLASVLRLSIAINGAAVIALIVIADPLVPWLFGDEFRPAIPLARLLLVAAFLFGVRRVLTDALLGEGRANAATAAELVALGVYGLLAVAQWQSASAIGFAIALVIAAGAGLASMALTLVGTANGGKVEADTVGE